MEENDAEECVECGSDDLDYKDSAGEPNWFCRSCGASQPDEEDSPE